VRIKTIETFTVALPFNRPEKWSGGARLGCANVLIKLTTDDGVIGWGESSGGSGGSVSAVRAAVDSCAPFVSGMDPFNVESLRARILQLGRWRNLHRLANLVIAGYEIAFFDIMGKICERPVSDLLGGRLRESISLYGYVLTDEQSGMVANAVDLVKRGFHILYTKVGWNLERDIRVLGAIREAVGPSPRIRIDANEMLSPFDAINWIRALSQFDIEFFEQPTPALDLEGMRRIRDASPIPIAANQGLWSIEEVLQVIRAGAADVLVTGPQWVGGLLALKKVAALADAASLPFCRHSPPETGISTAAGLHVLATLPHLMDGNQIYLGQVLVEDVLEDGQLTFEGGDLVVPNGVGLGVDVNQDKVHLLAKLYEEQGEFAQWDEQLQRQATFS
jgi:L-alanine-DL-glutamate epimerase-like enolase superfamily enzyme